MKQYTGTTTLKAEPITMSEAYERKLLKEGVRPSECETDKAGYLVEYEGGYQSWLSADVFEKTYKPSETLLERLHIEREDVKERVDKLNSFFDKGLDFVIDKAGVGQTAMLIAQNTMMCAYRDLLDVRIEYIEEMLKEDK